MRGYFDGDGCIWKTGNQLRFSILGTKQFLTHYQMIFEKNLLVRSHVKIHNKGNVFALNYSGNKQVRKIANFLYDNSTVFLQRKFDKLS